MLYGQIYGDCFSPFLVFTIYSFRLNLLRSFQDGSGIHQTASVLLSCLVSCTLRLTVSVDLLAHVAYAHGFMTPRETPSVVFFFFFFV